MSMMFKVVLQPYILIFQLLVKCFCICCYGSNASLYVIQLCVCVCMHVYVCACMCMCVITNWISFAFSNFLNIRVYLWKGHLNIYCL